MKKRNLLRNMAMLAMLFTFSGCDFSKILNVYWKEEVPEVAGSIGLEYELNDDGVYHLIGMGDCKDAEVIIPATYKSLPVVAIDTGAFSECDFVVKVKILDGVMIIGDSAFWGCCNLTDIEIPQSVVRIGASAFYGCCSLTEVVLPQSVVRIGSSAFSDCHELEKIEIPSGVVSVGMNAFRGCEQLEYNLYQNVAYLGNAKNPYVALVGAMDNLQSAYTIHSETKVIGDGAFNGCSDLMEVELPNGLISIGERSFQACGLISLDIPESVAYIGSDAFERCWLKEINVSGNNQEYCSFQGNLYTKDQKTLVRYAAGKDDEVFTIPDGVTAIGEDAFSYVQILDKLVVSNSVTTIGYGAFDYANLMRVEIGRGVTDIPSRAFSYCDQLQEIVVEDSNEFYASQDGVLYDKAGTKLIRYPIAKEENSFIVPDGVSSIRISAFYDCKNIESIIIPNSVKKIETDAFRYCRNLSSIDLGDGIEAIGSSSFADCEALLSIVIGRNVTSIGGGAFRGCKGLSVIEFKGTIAEWNGITKKDGSWNSKVPAQEVVCMDGKVMLSA